MRRAEREVTDKKRIDEIIRSAEVMRLGFFDGEVYIVPVNYGYEHTATERVFYFHGARAGRKYNLIQTSPEIGFELDTGYRLITGDTACAYTAAYSSVIGTGVVTELTDPAEKARALGIIMNNHAAGTWTFEEKTVERTGVFKLTVNKLSCKENLK